MLLLQYLLAIIGMNDRMMAISEIGVSYPDDTFGKESRFGVPFTVSTDFKDKLNNFVFLSTLSQIPNQQASVKSHFV